MWFHSAWLSLSLYKPNDEDVALIWKLTNMFLKLCSSYPFLWWMKDHWNFFFLVDVQIAKLKMVVSLILWWLLRMTRSKPIQLKSMEDGFYWIHWLNDARKKSFSAVSWIILLLFIYFSFSQSLQTLPSILIEDLPYIILLV